MIVITENKKNLWCETWVNFKLNVLNWSISVISAIAVIGYDESTSNFDIGNSLKNM